MCLLDGCPCPNKFHDAPQPQPETQIDPLRTRPDYDFRCQRCSAPHNLDTSIPSDIWNQIVERDSPGGDKYGALCTLCIDDLMDVKGLTCEAEFYFGGKALKSRRYDATTSQGLKQEPAGPQGAGHATAAAARTAAVRQEGETLDKGGGGMEKMGGSVSAIAGSPARHPPESPSAAAGEFDRALANWRDHRNLCRVTSCSHCWGDPLLATHASALQAARREGRHEAFVETFREATDLMQFLRDSARGKA